MGEIEWVSIKTPRMGRDRPPGWQVGCMAWLGQTNQCGKHTQTWDKTLGKPWENGGTPLKHDQPFGTFKSPGIEQPNVQIWDHLNMVRNPKMGKHDVLHEFMFPPVCLKNLDDHPSWPLKNIFRVEYTTQWWKWPTNKDTSTSKAGMEPSTRGVDHPKWG